MNLPSHLYKVAAPRSDMTFSPRSFWHTEDWESSTDRPRKGYLEDAVLFAGDFAEVSIHLFPRVRTVRVSTGDADCAFLSKLGLRCSPGRVAYIFVAHTHRCTVEAFHPTIFQFDARGFVRVRRGEYVSWAPQKAIAVETISMGEALSRWNVEACYVEDLDDLIATLSAATIYFEEQT